MGWQNAGGWYSSGWERSVAGGGGTTATFDAISTFNNGGSALGGTTATWTHTPVGTPTAAVVVVAYFGTGASDIVSVTYGGSTMSLLASADSGTDTSFMYGLANPPAGAASVVITFNQTGLSMCSASVTATGSDTATCFRGVGATNTGNSTSPTVTCTSGLSNDLIIAFSESDGGGSMSFSSGGTDRGGVILGGIHSDIVTAAGAASVTVNWTTGSSPWSAIAGAIKHG